MTTETSIKSAIPFNEAVEGIILSYNADMGEYESENTLLRLELASALEKLDSAICENKKITGLRDSEKSAAKGLAKSIDKVNANAKHHLQLIEQKEREITQIKSRFDDVNASLSAYKELGTPKKIREKFKSYQADAKKNQAAIASLKNKANDDRHDIKKSKKKCDDLLARIAEIDITTVYDKAGESVYLFPRMVKLASRGMTGLEACLLYLNEEGRGGLMSLNDEGNASIPASKKPVRPKAATIEKSTDLLKRFKRNGWKLSPSDLRDIGYLMP
jgi:hypothetical protein